MVYFHDKIKTKIKESVTSLTGAAFGGTKLSMSFRVTRPSGPEPEQEPEVLFFYMTSMSIHVHIHVCTYV